MNISGSRLFSTSPLVVLLVVTMSMFAVNLFVLDEAWSWGHNVFLAGVVSFCVIYMLAIFFSTGGRLKTSIVLEREIHPPSSALVGLYWLLSVVGLLLSLYRIWKFGINGPMEGGVLFNLRYVYIWGSESNYGAQHFSLFACCLSLYYAQRRRIGMCLLSGSIYLIAALALAERTSILFLFVSLAYTLFFVGWIKIRGLLLFFCLLILLFCVIAVATGRAGGDKGYGFLFAYFGYAVTALQSWVENKDGLGCADLIFGKLLDILSVGNYACVPYDVGFADDDFNVLTYVSSPYLVGGVPIVIASMALLGGWYAFLRRYALSKGGYFLAMLSCYMYALVMVFYAWQFSLTTFIYVGVILVPLFFEKDIRRFVFSPGHL